MINKKSPITTNSQIKVALRMLFLRSKERAEVLKRDNYSCQKCGVKKSQKKDNVIKVEVHHISRIDNWDKIIDEIRKYLLCPPEEMETLCKNCHKNIYHFHKS